MPRHWAASSRRRSLSSDSASGVHAAISIISGKRAVLGGSRAGMTGFFRPNLKPRASVAAMRTLARFFAAFAEEGRGIGIA